MLGGAFKDHVCVSSNRVLERLVERNQARDAKPTLEQSQRARFKLGGFGIRGRGANSKAAEASP